MSWPGSMTLGSFFNIENYLRIAKYKLMRALTSHLSKSAGNIAIAFALNRIGTPPRIFLTTWLMPYTAPRINALVNPYLRKIGVVFGKARSL